MKNMFFLLIFFSSFSFSSDMYAGHCIEDYYFQNGKIHYLKSKTSNWNTATFYKYKFDSGYVYNSNDNTCRKSQNLGLTPFQYNFLYSLIGLFFGLSLFWLVPSK